jgi:3-oxoacyl-[acyl-carrier-protein] synthase-1
MKNAVHKITITTKDVVVDDKPLDVTCSGSDMLTELYRKYVNDYPKYFKMDILCKLGFIATELLLQAEGNERFVPCEDRAVVLFNRSSSLNADASFENTIRNREKFYPSPAVFVYTLPNIVTGEIAIRNKYYGETNFIVTEKCDDSVIEDVVDGVFTDDMMTSVVTGWLDAESGEKFNAEIYIIEK